MQTVADLVWSEWLKLLQDEITQKSEIVVKGLAVQSFEDYRRRTGEIAGMMRAADLLREAQDNVNKRE